MNSGNKSIPADQNSRRDFLQKVGALAAAAAPVAGNAAVQAPASAAGAQSMPMVPYGKHMISRLVIGSNTLGGLSHLSRFIDLEMRKYNTPEQLLADFKHALEVGINCQESGRLNLVEQVNKLGVGKLLFASRGEAKWEGASWSWQGRGWRHPKETAANGCIGIHHGGGATDIFWRAGKLDRVREWCKMVRDTGVLVAITSHRPEVYDIIESQDWDVDYYMPCLYKYGRTKEEWEKDFAFNPGLAPAEIGFSREANWPLYGGETAFTRGDPTEMLKIVKQTKKPCWVYKLLASGRLCEKPEFVEATFKHVFSNIKKSDVVVVGHYTKHEDQYGLNAEYVRRFSNLSI